MKTAFHTTRPTLQREAAANLAAWGLTAHSGAVEVPLIANNFLVKRETRQGVEKEKCVLFLLQTSNLINVIILQYVC